MNAPMKTMRDVLIETLQERMNEDQSIYFLTADLGAPALDNLRSTHPGRCINVGIAEQNLIEVATGLALEGMTVYAYGIAPFISMRSYEQIRNVAMLCQTRETNLNIISLGVGFSYDVSGPTHQCLEDVTLMRLLPNLEFFSPSDTVQTQLYVDRTIQLKKPKYLRFDGKPLPALHEPSKVDFSKGFAPLRDGKAACLVTTGFATHEGVKLADTLAAEGIQVGHVDVFQLNTCDADALVAEISKYRNVFTLEEAFIRKGGLDSLVADLILDRSLGLGLKRYGPSDRYIFDNGSRNYLYRAYSMDKETIASDIRASLATAQ